MIPDKDLDRMNALEKRRSCEFWLTEGWGNGFCRIVGRKQICHFSSQNYPTDCSIRKAFGEGIKHEKNSI